VDPQTLLQQLAPLREPPAISWWPPAPGWWLVATMVLVGLAVSALLLWRRHRHNRYRRLAKAQLQTLTAQGELTVANLNRLIKATALRVWPAAQVANLHGSEWQAFLVATAPKLAKNSFDELDQLYLQPEQPASDLLMAATQQWIAQHRRDLPHTPAQTGAAHD